MRINCFSEVPHPVAEVVRLVRDDLPALARFLPDVESITIERREVVEAGTRTTSLWRGSPRAAPRLLRGFLSPELLSWKEHAFWPAGSTHAEWSLEPRIGSSLFECSGTTRLEEGEAPNSTRLSIQGELSIHPERFPGVPRLLARTLRPAIEEFVARMLVPNLQTLAQGVEGYFASSQFASSSVD